VDPSGAVYWIHLGTDSTYFQLGSDSYYFVPFEYHQTVPPVIVTGHPEPGFSLFDTPAGLGLTSTGDGPREGGSNGERGAPEKRSAKADCAGLNQALQSGFARFNRDSQLLRNALSVQTSALNRLFVSDSIFAVALAYAGTRTGEWLGPKIVGSLG
jgi:hypothetical protein